MLAPNNFPEKLTLFQKVFIEEFLREFQFLVDVAAGRAEARADFTDKVLGLAKKAGFNLIGKVGLPFTAVVTKGIEVGIDFANTRRKENKQAQIQKAAYEVDPEKLRILLEMAAFEACRRHESVMMKRLIDTPLDGIIPLAKAGVERMLEYVVRNQQLPTEEGLLMGLIAGRSGAYVTGYTNTQLKTREAKTSAVARIKGVLGFTGFTAEGVYGRSGYSTQKGWWMLKDQSQASDQDEDNDEAHSDTSSKSSSASGTFDKLFNFGFTHFLEGATEPKYGYAQVPSAILQKLTGQLVRAGRKHLLQQVTELSQEMSSYQPAIQAIDKATLQSYLQFIHDDSHANISLIGYLQKANPNICTAYYCPDDEKDWDLSDLDLTGGCFDGCVFNHCVFGGSLKNTSWKEAHLRCADFRGVTTMAGATFTSAHLEFANAEGVNFQGAILTQTDFRYANMTNADIRSCDHTGAIWADATITHLKSDKLKEIESEQAQQRKELTVQQKQLEALYVQGAEQQAELKTLHQRLDELERISDPALQEFQQLVDAITQEQQSRLAFERYCKAELILLKQRQAQAQNVQAKQKQALQLLRTQLDKLIQQQQSFKQLIQSVCEVDIKALGGKLTKLEERFETEVEAQRTAIRELQKGFQQLNNRMDQLESGMFSIRHHQGTMRGKLAVVLQHYQKQEQTNIDQLEAEAQKALRCRYESYGVIKGAFGKQFTMSQSYINLQMIKTNDKSKESREENKPEKNKDKSHTFRDERLTSFEDLFGEKQVVAVSDLFKLDQKAKDSTKVPNFLMIQGRAGIGKTTFVNYVSYEWASGRLWDFKWVFSLPLRQLRSGIFEGRSSVPLYEWIYEAVFAGNTLSLEDFKKLWIDRIQSDLNNGHVLIILDGYDELPGSEHPCASALESLLTGSLCKVPKIITSRPYGIGELPRERQDLEIIGFTNDNIKRYIAVYFAESKEKEKEIDTKLIQSLEANPSLWGSAHIPITLNLICGVYQEEITQRAAWGETFQSEGLLQIITMTGLYQRMEQKFLERAYPKSEQSKKAKLSRFYGEQRKTYLYRTYEKSLGFLSELAFRGLEEEHILLPPPLIARLLGAHKIEDDKVESFISECHELGFIRPIWDHADKKDESERSYEFLHLTFQEYFAARYLAQDFLSSGEKFQEARDFVLRNKFSPRYQIVFWFVAGLLKQDAQALQSYFDVIQDEATKDLIGDYQAGLLARCYEESFSKDSKVHEQIFPVLKQVFKGWYDSYPNENKSWYLYSSEEPINKTSQFFAMLSLCPTLTLNTELLADVIEAHRFNTKYIDFIVTAGLFHPKLVHNLIICLADEVVDVRYSAANAFGKMGEKVATPEVIAALMPLLADEHENVRYSAARLLGKIGKMATQEVITVLIPCLADSNKNIQYFAGEALSEMGEKAVTPEVIAALVPYLKDENYKSRCLAAQVLGKMGKKMPEIIAALMPCLADKNWDVRNYADASLDAMREKAATPEVIAALVLLLADENFFVQQYAAETLGKIGEKAATPEVIAALVSYLVDEEMNKVSRKLVVNVLDGMGEKAATPEVIAALVLCLSDEDKDVRSSTAIALRKMGEKAATPEVIAALVLCFVDEDVYVRYRAAYALGDMGEKAITPEVIAALVLLFADENSEVQDFAANVLGWMGEKAATQEVIAALIPCLADEHEDVRCYAAKALGKMGKQASTPEVIAALVPLLADEHYYIQIFAADALVRMGEQASTPEVIAVLVPCLADENENARCFAADVLARMGEKAAKPEVIAALVPLLVDEYDYVRRPAADALGNMGEKAATPEIIAVLVSHLMGDRASELGTDVVAARVFLLMGEKAATPEIIAALVPCLVDKRSMVRCLVADALAYIDKRVVCRYVFGQTYNQTNCINILALTRRAYEANDTISILRENDNNDYLIAYPDGKRFKQKINCQQAQYFRRLIPLAFSMSQGEQKLDLEKFRKAFSQIEATMQTPKKAITGSSLQSHGAMFSSVPAVVATSSSSSSSSSQSSLRMSGMKS